MTTADLKATLRIRQWTKNIVLFAALVFAGRASSYGDVFRTMIAFALFSFLSSAVYVLNDLHDIERDRCHPAKKNRPIPAGRISQGKARVLLSVLAVVSLGGSFALDPVFGAVAAAYFLLQVLYTFVLKFVAIVDVFAISFGFLFRIIAGAVVIHVTISNWILVCAMLLALFLALSKRRNELALLECEVDTHRVILREYSPYLLDQMIGVVTSATLVTYMIFILSPETEAKFGKYMVLTVPFVLYGIFRYLFLVHSKKEGGHPEEVLLADMPLQLAIAGYGITAIIIIYFT